MASGLDFIGPHGGELAVAFGTGCAAGYAFCVRTIHKMLQSHSDKEHQSCMDRIEALEGDKKKLEDRVLLLEERWLMGTQRQMAQIRESGTHMVEVLGAEKLGRPPE